MLNQQTGFKNVLVLIPTLNEEVALPATLKSVRAALPEARILVIDNGSTDQTVNIAHQLSAEVLREPNKGKGFAVRRGFRAVDDTVEVIVMVDGDDTYGCENLSMAVNRILDEGFDMVVGTRVPTGQLDERKPVYKRGHTLGNRFFTTFSSILHPVGIEDSLSGWRVMSRGFVRSFAGGATGFEIEAELNAHAYILQAPVSNVDVSYRGRGADSHSKLNTYSDGIKILRMNLSQFRNNRPQLAFSLLASPWLVISTYLVARASLAYIDTGLVLQFPSLIAGVGCFIVAALLFVTGMILQRVKMIRSSIAHFRYSD